MAIKLHEELSLSYDFIKVLVKSMISSSEINASIDNVSDELLIEKERKVVQRRSAPVIRVGSVSDVWYLVPLFLGLLGGVLAYYAIKDDDREKVTNMIYLGVASTILGWLFYQSYIASLFSYY